MRRHQNPFIPLPAALSVLLTAAALASPLQAAELVQGVRSKVSAADLASGEAAVEAYRLSKGVDPEYLNAVGWLARGAEMLGKRDKAAARVAELRREIPTEASETIVPLGAAIEVEGKTPTYTLVDRKGRVRFYSPTRVSEAELARLIESVLSE
jgi:hypothetical protein